MGVLLDEDGIFEVTTPSGMELVYFDGGEPNAPNAEGRDDKWLRVVSTSENGSFALVGIFLDLDEALKAIADTSRFSVTLPDGRHFSRPGNKPAIEVLASSGYEIVRKASVFAIVEYPNHLSPDEVRLEVATRLQGQNVNVGSAERIDETTDDGWSVEILVPMEGVYATDKVRDAVLRYVGTPELTLASVIEVDGVELPDPQPENVISVAFGKPRKA